MNFRAIWSCRAPCEPVICPSDALLESNEPPAGPPLKVQIGVLNALKASRRSCKVLRSPRLNSFCRLASRVLVQGPRMLPTEQVPKEPPPVAMAPTGAPATGFATVPVFVYVVSTFALGMAEMLLVANHWMCAGTPALKGTNLFSMLMGPLQFGRADSV